MTYRLFPLLLIVRLSILHDGKALQLNQGFDVFPQFLNRRYLSDDRIRQPVHGNDLFSGKTLILLDLDFSLLIPDISGERIHLPRYDGPL